MFAILAGFVVYVAVPAWLAVNLSTESLIGEKDAVFRVARFSSLIYAGVWGATLSSAVGSILTAPRTLEALAIDGLVPRLFARRPGAREPVAGLLLTFLLSEAAIFVGTLDAVAPVLTMFFLATYGLTNLACGLQRWAASPSFRPTFKLPASVSLSAALACFYGMSIINFWAMLAALFVAAAIFTYTQRRDIQTTYGDARHGIWSALVRSSLQRLRRAKFHPRNWRPNLVILGGDPKKRPYLLHLGSAIVQDRGLVTYFHLLKGAIREQAEMRRNLFDAIEPKMAARFPNVFYRVDITSDVYEGAVSLAQSYGVGNFEANSVMLGWPKKVERMDAYVQMLRDLVALDRSVLLVHYKAARKFGFGKKIHIWWGGLQGNGGLMLLLAHLIQAHEKWRQADVTVLTVVKSEETKRKAEKTLEGLLKDARMEASAHVILKGERSLPSIMQTESEKADLAIVGFALPKEGVPSAPFLEKMNANLGTAADHAARSLGAPLRGRSGPF